ncbi:hypothetical protein KUD11_01530 [Roseovarius sp. LXJ103]|uniref:hypothetical protein n=1 Tax=Roseovarius carneus TaxID=2853164 RepID=UPI000D61367F|nr:hypothetical protein [Roseovarius carneus]MBZ8117321.1 hypothetical protein [Roseovarius carneus]PWE36855.1 hypothetical protein DD563_13400 [Pelagicola sp. LXJ1103]
MRLLLLPLAVLLAACDTPGPDFRGVEPVRISVGQSVFDVRVDGLRAEAIRLNAEWAPRLEAVASRGVMAIEEVSGCQVRDLDGDPAQMTARLNCGGRKAPLPRGTEYSCDVFAVSGGLAELSCEPL